MFPGQAFFECLPRNAYPQSDVTRFSPAELQTPPETGQNSRNAPAVPSESKRYPPRQKSCHQGKTYGHMRLTGCKTRPSIRKPYGFLYEAAACGGTTSGRELRASAARRLRPVRWRGIILTVPFTGREIICNLPIARAAAAATKAGARCPSRTATAPFPEACCPVPITVRFFVRVSNKGNNNSVYVHNCAENY